MRALSSPERMLTIKGVKIGLLNARNRNIQEHLERGGEYTRNEWRERTDIETHP